MRTCVFLLVATSLCGACGETDATLVSADAPPNDEAGCVVAATRPVPPTTRTATEDGPRRVWTVRQGDSLRKIARELYGDERLWKAIRDANPSKVGRDGAIAVGATLVVPYDGI